MALVDTTWYIKDNGVTGWTGVPVWAATTAYTVGQFVRQLATPTVGNERVFVCVIAGTSLVAEPTWVVTRGAKTAEAAGPTWQEATGQPSLNGDSTNTTTWTQAKAASPAVLGQIIKNVSGGADTYFICTTAGAMGAGEPVWNKTAGATTADSSATWTSLGAISSFTTAWAAPFARMNAVAAVSFMLAGNTGYVSNNHAETAAASWTWPTTNGTAALPLKFICVNDSVAPPTTETTGATVATTGANSINLGTANVLYSKGNGFLAGSAANTANINLSTSNGIATYENVTLQLNNTSTTSRIMWSSPSFNIQSNATVNIINPTVVFGSTSQAFNPNSGTGGFSISMIGGTYCATGSVPTTLFSVGVQQAFRLLIRDADCTSITGTLFTGSLGGYLDAWDIKTGSGAANSVTVVTGAQSYSRICCFDSAATSYRYNYNNGFGSIVQETTIVRTGGATDGVTPISWNMTSNSSASAQCPFISDEISVYIPAALVGTSLTPSLFFVSATASLSNANISVEWEYLGTSTAPLGSSVDTRISVLTTPTTIASDTSTWGGAIANKYVVAGSAFTPQIAGILKCRVSIRKASQQIYVDPFISIPGLTIGTSFMVPGQGYINTVSSGGAGASMIVHPGMVGGLHG